MNLNDGIQISSIIMLSVGGSSGIIFGLSSWLGKVWAARILEKEKSAYTKDIESIKARYLREIEQLKSEFNKDIESHKIKLKNQN